MRRGRRGAIKGLVAGCLGVWLYSFYEPVLGIELVRHRIDLDLGLEILFVTDTHLHGVPGREDSVIKLVEDLSREVDLTILGGDMYDEFSESLESFSSLLDAISGEAIMVLGNHEHWAADRYPLEETIEMAESRGVTVLRNGVVEYKGLHIGGVDWYDDNPQLARRYYRDVGNVDILVSHTPDILGDAEVDARLVLAGHTHGGQILGPLGLITNSRHGYVSGFYRRGEALMYVSRGAGEIIPFRLLTPREVTVLSV